jgi:ribonuclease HI
VDTENKGVAEGLCAYVDGSFRDGEAAYGCVILLNGALQAQLSGVDARFPETRNIYAELLGTVKAIEWAIERSYRSVTIYYDYSGVEKWANSAWKTNSIVSRRYKAYIEKLRSSIDISFVKVCAHSGDVYNELADKLARSALKADNVQTAHK